MGSRKDSWGARVLVCVMTLALVVGLLPTSAFIKVALAEDSDDGATAVVDTPQDESAALDSADGQEQSSGELSSVEPNTEVSSSEEQKSEEPSSEAVAEGTDDALTMTAQRDDDPNALAGEVLDGCTIRLRRHGTPGCLSINHDGYATGDSLVYWNIPDSFRFYLEKADEDSYYFHFFHEPIDKDYSTTSNAEVLAVEDKGGVFHNNYSDPSSVFHVKKRDDDYTKRYQIVPATDGRFKIMCKESGMYWVVGDKGSVGQLGDGTYVHQSYDGDEWDIEIIDAGGSTSAKGNDAPYNTFDQTFAMQKKYDSYTFTYNGQTVTASDWMSHLPDDTPLSDLNIPATHDTGTCNMEHDVTTFGAECQSLFIDDQFTAGVRLLDIRCDSIVTKNDVSSPKLNHLDDCQDRDGKILTVNDVLTYTRAFLAAHPGETVIFMVNRQDGDRVKIFDYWEDLVENNSGEFYIGDHVPSLGEARGKIVLLMKIDLTDEAFNGRNPDLIYGDKEGETRQWALDINPVKGHKAFDEAGDSVLVRQEPTYDVWIEDDYKVDAQTKWSRSTVPALDNASKHRDDAIANGKYAWIINYTSCSAMTDEFTTPINGARYTNHRLKAYFDESFSNTFNISATNGKYEGVVPMDFVDEFQCQLVYRQNFIMAMPKVIKGEGTEDNPYLIKDINTWNDFANIVNAGATYVYAKMTADVSSVTTMVGTAEHPFMGTFDGNGHTLRVSIDANEEAAAPFHWIGNATIRNLRVEGDVKGNKHTAGLVGYVCDETGNIIEDVTVSTTVHMTDTYYCAGIVGHVKRSATTLNRCIFEGSIEGGENVGVLVGWGDNDCIVNIFDCLEKGSTYTAPNVNPIGLVSDWPTVTDTYALSDVKGSPKQNYEGVVKVYADKPAGESIEVTACDGNTYYLPVEVEVSLSTNRESVSLDSEKLKEKASALFSDEEISQIKDGAKLKVWLEVQMVDKLADVPAADAALLQKRAGELGSTLGEYALITLYKQVGDGSPTKITELPEGMDPIHLGWTVPQKLRASGRTFAVMSVHDGEVLEHESTTKDNVVSFDVAKLSTFTLTHADAKSSDSGSGGSKGSTSGSLAKTGDNSVPMAYVLTAAALGMLCLAWGALVRRRERR